MSDTTGQPSEGLDLLRLPQIFFQPPRRGYVTETPHSADDPIVQTLRLRVAFVNAAILELQAKRPGLDALLSDARRHRFDAVMVWAFDRIARSVRHVLEVLDEFNHLNIEFNSFREQVDTGGPLGRALIVIIGAISELERSLIVERVKAGMRRARLEGRQIGRSRLDVNREQVVQDRRSGMSLTQVAKKHGISRASVCRLMKEAQCDTAVPAFAGSVPEQASAAGTAQ